MSAAMTHTSFARALATPLEAELLLALADWAGFVNIASHLSARELFERLDAFYRLTEGHIQTAGGLVVKSMGDAALIVFPGELADAGVTALLALKHKLDHWLTQAGLDSRLHVNVNRGRVVLGRMGRAGLLDVIGTEVNALAGMRSPSVGLSPAAFARLTPELQQRFAWSEPLGLHDLAKIQA